MPYPIRALRFGELLDTSFRLLCERFLLLLGILTCFLLPAFLTVPLVELALGAPQAGEGAEQLQNSIWVAAVEFVALMTLHILASAPVTRVMVALCRGESTGFADALRRGLPVALPLLGTVLLAALLFGIAGAITFFLASGLPTPLNWVLALSLVVIGTYFYLPLLLLGPIAVLERTFFFAALSRSAKLMKGHRGRALGLQFVTGLVFLILLLPLFFLANLPWVDIAAELLAQAIAGAYGGALEVLFYFDLRCRVEGYDLEQLTAAVAERTAAG